MSNTYCKDCIFASTSDQPNSCRFNIPEMIKDNHNVCIKDNYNYIENYRCFYGFDKNILEQNRENLTSESVENMVLTKSKISYYLVIDIRIITLNDISNIVCLINGLDIKPQYVSFIIIPTNDTKEIFKFLNENIDKNIKWKLHTFLDNMSLNDVMNISVETNIGTANSSLLFIYDYSQKDSLELNSAINYIHYNFIIQQINLFGLKHEGLHGLCIPISIYRSLLVMVDRDILKAIEMTPEIKLACYEIEKSI